MKIHEIKSSNDFGWNQILATTKSELTNLFEEEVNFMGGYCFHLALALLLKSAGRNVSIIADGGHVALYDIDNDVSIDARGVHRNEDALSQRTKRSWTVAKKFIAAVSKGWASDLQLQRLQQTFDKYNK